MSRIYGRLSWPGNPDHWMRVVYLGLTGGYPFVRSLEDGEEFVWRLSDIERDGSVAQMELGL